MELELKKTCLHTYESVGELLLSQEETAETIVPDYCPDIERIIVSNGTVFLRSRETVDGKAELCGTIRVAVLYVPDHGKGIQNLEFAIPFTVSGESHSISDCNQIFAETELDLLETRMLNPRKIFTRCKILSKIHGYKRTMLEFCSELDAEPEFCVQKRVETQRASLLTCIAEKDFTFAEEIHLSPGRKGAVELLTGCVFDNITETKVIGSKLMLKGMFSVELLYRTEDNECCAVAAELPFSQVMEVDAVSEDTKISVQLQLSGTDFQLDSADEEGRQIGVTLYFRAVAFLREEKELQLLNDLYSTMYELQYDAKPLSLIGFYDTIHRRQMVREVLEIGTAAESVLSTTATCGTVSVTREKENAVLHAGINVRVLYLDESGAYRLAERNIDTSCRAELPERCNISAKAVNAGDIQTTIGDRGIEVRIPLEYRIEAAAEEKKACICTAKVDETAVKDCSGAPSLVLRCIGRQEKVWDLAKQYNTTIAEILAANCLDSEQDIPHEKMLLIPRKRA